MEKNTNDNNRWLTLVFASLLILSSLVIVVNNNAFAVTVTPVTTQATTISADLAKRLGGNDTGIYYPLYDLSELPQVLAAKQTFPNVPFGVIINPASGPGTAPSTEWTNAIMQLKSAGAVVTGYVPTGYGKMTIANVEGMILSYQQFYPNMLDGISLDEVSGSSSNFTYYKTISDYARSIGFSYIGANPGSPIYQGDVPLFNLIEIYESSGYPSESTLASRTFYPQYSKDVVGFEAKIHTQPTYDSAWLHMATKYVKWIYITDQTEPNPYAVFPSYFNQYLSDLSLAGTILGELQVGNSNGACKAIGGTWDSSTNTCTIANLAINTGKLLTIDSGVTLTV
ncbi:MAG TPA: spherulation-specific family 4 protein, partial [Nitrosopumilaceae archaeon]|nr:spherulation-specific family 4 protein [Nitrosopumilaceae archaeon]